MSTILKLARLVRPFWMSGSTENDWWEDAPHENGGYYRKCMVCGTDFIGHKRRMVCRKCQSEATIRYNAMSNEDREAHDARVVASIEELYRTNTPEHTTPTENHK